MEKEKIKDELKELINSWDVDEVEVELEETPDPNLGDLGTPVAFKLASKLKMSPNKIAEKIKEEIKLEEVGNIEIENGYVNFFFKDQEYFNKIYEIIKKENDFGSLKTGKNQVVTIEHTSVNPNKPLHIGHARNSILGDTLGRIMNKAGYEVKIQNYIDDLGLQVAKVLWGYRNLEIDNKKFDHALGDLYVKVHEELESENHEIREIVKELEEGSEQGREIVEKCVEAQMETTSRMNIQYDLLCWESDIISSGIFNEVFEEIKESENFVKEETGENAGCTVMHLEDYFPHMENPDKVLIRSDGTATYTAKDIAYQMWKFGLVNSKMNYKKWGEIIENTDEQDTWSTHSKGETKQNEKSDLVVNVVGSEQKYPQKIVALGLKLLDHQKEFENSYHLAYDLARLPEQSFSGRKGTWKGYSLDKVLEEAVSRSKEVIKEKNPDLSEEKIKEIAEKVGIGAVRYNLLKKNPQKELVFKWDEALSLEGESSPYIQYAHARCSSILRKSNKNIKQTKIPKNLELQEQEKKLVKNLTKYPRIIEEASKEKRPHLISHYVNDLVQTFNEFYRDCKVLTDNEETKKWRLALVKSTKIVLKDSLNIMGIEAPNRM